MRKAENGLSPPHPTERRDISEVRADVMLRFNFLVLAMATGMTLAAQAGQAPAVGRDGTKLYAELCAGCHGEQLQGGKGGSLVNGKWKHGGDEASLIKTITQGYPRSGMPGFAATVTPAEVLSLITFIKETATRRKEPEIHASFALPIGTQKSEEQPYRMESVAEGLDVPWSLTFLPDGRLLVTERAGRLRVIDHGKLLPEPVEGVPEVVVKDEAGLMSVVADPDFAQNQLLYLSFSDPGPDETAMTKIIRARLQDNRLEKIETVFAIPRENYQPGYVLFGGRLVVDGDYLFFSVGERGMEEKTTGQAQDLTVPNGKIHRVFRDGKIPPDNPFLSQEGAFPSIWAYGVRNPQGLARDPVTGDLWETEHGPRGGDELNRIQRGLNYGWPIITYGMNYDGTPITDKTHAPGMEQPVVNWTPSIAASEIEFYHGDRFPKWKNNLFVGSLAQQKFLRFVVKNGKVVHQEELFKNLGRVRDIKTGPDGFLYVALELVGEPGRIVRLVPPEAETEANDTTSNQ
jgi:glucose/arabinose dehydrogenase